MNSNGQGKRTSPSSELAWTAIANIGLALFLVVGTWVVVAEKFATFISLSDMTAVVLAILVVTLIGLLTCLAGRIRPGWPDSEVARAGEFTRTQVQWEWSKPIRLAQEMTSAMEDEVRRIGPGDAFQGPEQLVINRLHLNMIRTTKAALSMIQAGFPESALREWRTLFEIRVNAAYIAKKNRKVSQRFIEWGRMNELRRTNRKSEQLKTMRTKWLRRKLQPDNYDGWTGNPPEDLINRARDTGLKFGSDIGQHTEMDVYKLANAFVHADWTASSSTIGGLSPEVTDGTARGVGEILYLTMETAAATVMQSASDEVKERLVDDLWDLRLMIRSAPERLRGEFIRMPLTEPVIIFPDGRILVSTVKRREEWPEEAEKRSINEMRELYSGIQVVEEKT